MVRVGGTQQREHVGSLVETPAADQAWNQPEAERRILLERAGKATLEQPRRFVVHAMPHALLAECRAVFGAAAHLEIVDAALQIGIGIDRPHQLARLAPRRTRLARGRKHLDEVIDDAAEDRKREDDQRPPVGAPGLEHVVDETALNDQGQGGDQRHCGLSGHHGSWRL